MFLFRVTKDHDDGRRVSQHVTVAICIELFIISRRVDHHNNGNEDDYIW